MHTAKKERKITKKKSPATVIQSLKQQHYHHQDNKPIVIKTSQFFVSYNQ
jgi:hypothetical protein